MKLIKIMIGLFAISIAMNACQDSTNNAVLYKKIHPKKSLNQELNDIDFQNKFTLIDFWATWCAPCIKGFDHLNKLASNSDLKSKYNFIIISDEAEEKVKKRLADRELKVISLIDSLIKKKNNCGFMGKTFTEFDICALPQAVILNANGNQIWKGQAKDLTPEKLKSFYEGKTLVSDKKSQVKNQSKEVIPQKIDTIKTNDYIFLAKEETQESNRSATAADFSRFAVKGHSAEDLLMKITNYDDYKFVIDKRLSDNYYSLKYHNKSENFSEEEHRIKVMDLFLTQFSLKMDTVQKQAEFKILNVSNLQKLNEAVSIEAEDSYHAGYDFDSDKDKGEIVIINSKLDVLIKILNEYYDEPYQLSGDALPDLKYDMVITYENKKDILKVLEQRYGLTFLNKAKNYVAFEVSKK